MRIGNQAYFLFVTGDPEYLNLLTSFLRKQMVITGFVVINLPG
jgi:hypothetical protein